MGDITDGDKDNGVTDTLDALSLEWQQKNGVSIDQLENSSVQNQEKSIRNRVLFEELRPIFLRDPFQTVLVSLLQEIIKPRLSQYKHAKLTDQGTQRIRPSLNTEVTEEVNPAAEVITILNWISKRLEKSTIQSNWHLIFPPILILLDSTHADVRTQTTTILLNILDCIDEAILRKTGLAEVIWAAIVPNLSSLPPITDLQDSVALLRVTYTALIQLAKLWKPSLPTRIPLLDKVLRDGVIYGMLFSADKLQVAQVQLAALDSLIQEMGIYFVKHLKDTMPIISSILANPLGSNHPPQLLQAIHILDTMISICWPRIGNHHVEILRGIITCWRYLRNQDSPDLIPVRKALKCTTQALLAASSEAKIDLTAISATDSYYAELKEDKSESCT